MSGVSSIEQQINSIKNSQKIATVIFWTNKIQIVTVIIFYVVEKSKVVCLRVFKRLRTSGAQISCRKNHNTTIIATTTTTSPIAA